MSNDGYILDIDYIYGYFAEQAPVNLRLALLSKGIANNISGSSSYLELGFGQGLTLAINAATSRGEYYGTDFNPSQVASARRLMEATGRDIKLFDQSFEEFARRTDLPQFDIIALHGIWSWVSDDSRAAIVQIAKNNLKPGGILYVSYNTNPGWSPATPMRHLLREYARRAATGSLMQKAEQSLDFVDSIMQAGARYFVDNPGLQQRLDRMRASDKTYVLHEYFNENWHPMSFIDISEMLSEAKLSYAASANLLDNIDSLSIPESARRIIDALPDENLRQMTRDFFVGQQFRRDIFQKGVRSISGRELREEVNSQSFVLVDALAPPPSKILTSAGEAQLLEGIYGPVVQAILSDLNEDISASSISARLSGTDINFWQVWEALLVLTGAGWLSPKSDCSDLPDVIDATRSLNREIVNRSVYSEQIKVLASHKTAAGISYSRIEQMLMYCYNRGSEDPCASVLEMLDAEGEKILSQGDVVEDHDAALVVLGQIWGNMKDTKLNLVLV